MHCAFRFGFKASNNEANYKALIAGLNFTKEMKVECLEIYSDSQLGARKWRPNSRRLRIS